MQRQRLSDHRIRRAWRTFSTPAGERIMQQLREQRPPCCPCCGELLEAQPDSRLNRSLPLDARGYDLDCRECRRFWCVAFHTARSIRLVRMRRLAAAVRAVRLEPAAAKVPATAAMA